MATWSAAQAFLFVLQSVQGLFPVAVERGNYSAKVAPLLADGGSVRFLMHFEGEAVALRLISHNTRRVWLGRGNLT